MILFSCRERVAGLGVDGREGADGCRSESAPSYASGHFTAVAYNLAYQDTIITITLSLMHVKHIYHLRPLGSRGDQLQASTEEAKRQAKQCAVRSVHCAVCMPSKVLI